MIRSQIAEALAAKAAEAYENRNPGTRVVSTRVSGKWVVANVATTQGSSLQVRLPITTMYPGPLGQSRLKKGK